MAVKEKDLTRVERDSMGTMDVPANAYYGASTQRAVLNFPISDLRFSRRRQHVRRSPAGGIALSTLSRGPAESGYDCSSEPRKGRRLDRSFGRDIGAH